MREFVQEITFFPVYEIWCDTKDGNPFLYGKIDFDRKREAYFVTFTNGSSDKFFAEHLQALIDLTTSQTNESNFSGSKVSLGTLTCILQFINNLLMDIGQPPELFYGKKAVAQVYKNEEGM